jgi:hypothetical protein
MHHSLSSFIHSAWGGREESALSDCKFGNEMDRLRLDFGYLGEILLLDK